MRRIQYHAPDAEAMKRLLEKHRYDATGVVVLLAWRAGLSRKEISELTWEQVDLDAELLRLPDREVPVDAELRDCLCQWRNRCERFSPYVAVSPRRRQRLVKGSLSLMARAALDEEGQKDVRLQDLRHDYIQRQLQEHDWPYVLRVTGLAVSTYRSGLHKLKAAPPSEAEAPEQETPDEAFRFWRVLQDESGTPAGIALWLTSRAGLQMREIVALTWEQIDFEQKLARLDGRTLELPAGAARVLEAEKAKRAPEDNPHVILSPRSRKPVTVAWLTTLVRSALIRGGLEGHSFRDFRLDPVREAEDREILAYVEERGSITRDETMKLLGLSDGQAYRRLAALTGAGKLDHVCTRYFLPGTVILPEQRPEAIRRYLRENGAAYLQDVAALLKTGKWTALNVLKSMTRSEQLLVSRSKQYYLPPETAEENKETVAEAAQTG